MADVLGLTVAENGQVVSTNTLSASQTVATGTTNGLSLALKGLGATIKAHPIITGLVVAGTAASIAYNKIKKYNEEIKKSAQESSSAWKESNSALSEQISKYEELKRQLDSGTLSSEEEYNTRKEILDIQNQITDNYGKQTSNIDLINGNLTTQLGLLQDISAVEAKTTLNKNMEEYDKSSKEMTRDRDYFITSFDSRSNNGVNKDILNLAKEFKEQGLGITDDGLGRISIEFVGDATQADKTLTEFMNRVSDLKGKYKNDDVSTEIINGIVSSASSALKDNQKILDDWQESYRSFLEMDMLSRGTEEGSIADTYDNYLKLIDKYNQAIASGDSESISKARAEVGALEGDIETLLNQEGNSRFAVMFEEAGQQINEATLKAYDFKEAMSGKTGEYNQFKNNADDIRVVSSELKKLKLDAVDAKAAFDTNGEQYGESMLRMLANSFGVDTSSNQELTNFINMLSDAGIVSGSLGDALERSSNTVTRFSSTVSEAKKNTESLKNIMKESVSGTGLSVESLQTFRDMFGDDAEKALEKTANGYHINQKALSQLQKQQDQYVKSEYLSNLDEEYSRLRDIESQLVAAALLDTDTSGLESTREGILNNIKALEDLNYQYEINSSAYQKWKDATSAPKESDMYEDMSSSVEELQDMYNSEFYGDPAFIKGVDMFSSKVITTAAEAKAEWEQIGPTISSMFTGLDDRSGLDTFAKRAQEASNVLGQNWVTWNSEMNDWQFSDDMDVKALADQMMLDVESVQAALRAFSIFGYDVNLDQPIMSMDELKTSADEAKQSLASMGDSSLNEINLNVGSLEDVDAQIQTTKDYIDSLQENSNIDIETRTDKVSDANDILEYLLKKKEELINTETIDLSMNIELKEEELQQGYDTLEKIKQNAEKQFFIPVGIEYERAQENLDSLLDEIEGYSPEMKLALGITGLSREEIISGVLDGSITIPVSADASQAQENIGEVDNQNVNNKEFDVIAHTEIAYLSLSFLKNKLDCITDKAVTVSVITYEKTIKDNFDPKGNVHQVNGTANVNGTSHARGNWGTAPGGRTLVGELGAEIVVNPHTGRYYTVGDHGAEFVQMPKNAIVFNHLQTKHLLENGSITSRGKALVTGTALAGAVPTVERGNNISYNSSTQASSSTFTQSSSSTSSAEEAAESAMEALEEMFDKFVDWIEVRLDYLNNVLDKTMDRFENEYIFDAIGETFKNALSALQQTLTETKAARERYLNHAYWVAQTEGLPYDIQNKIHYGTIDITQYDDDMQSKIKQYSQWYDKVVECDDAINELNESLKELYVDAFNKVSEQLDNAISQFEHRKNIIESNLDRLEAQGYLASKKYYTELIKQEQESLEKLQEKRDKLIQAMADAMENGKIEEYSSAWYEMQEEINSVTEAIEDAQNNNIEYNNSIRELDWDIYDKMQESISAIADEAEFLIDLLSSNDLFDDKGNINDFGKATLGLYTANYNTYMEQAEKYREEMESIQKDLAKDPNNQTLIDRRKELLELQQESILAAEEEKDAIKSLIEDGIDKQLDSLQNLIDKYKDALDTQKDLYDYEKELSGIQKEISDYEKQLASYAGDDSESGMLKRQEIENSLKEARENLEETQYDRFISDQEKMLDTLYSDYEETLNERLGDTDRLISEIIQNVNEESGAIRDTIVSAADKVGYVLTDSMGTVLNGQLGVSVGVLNAVKDIKKTISGYISNSDKIALKDITGVDWDKIEKNPLSYAYEAIMSMIPTLMSSVENMQSTQNVNNQITFKIDKIENYEDFISKLQRDSRIEAMIQEMTIGRALGNNSFSKYTINL